MDNEAMQERKEYIEHLAGNLLSAAEGASHTLLIEALITAFVAVAEKQLISHILALEKIIAGTIKQGGTL